MGDVTPEQVSAARNEAQLKAASATEYGARGYTLADELRKAVGERFGESPIAKEAATNRADFLAAAPQARLDVQGMINSGSILSPAQQQQILTSKRAAALAPVMGSNVLQEAAFGTMQDLINAGTNAFGAQTAREQGLAQLAQTNYANLVSELAQQISAKNQAQQLELQKQQANKKSTSIIESGGTQWLVDTQTGQKIADLGPAYHAGGGGSATEKTQAIFDQLKTDAATGMEFSQIMKKYTGKLDPADILVGYNAASKYGTLLATPEQINAKYGTSLKSQGYTEEDIANFANSVADGSMKITAVPQTIRGDVQTYANQIQKQKQSGISNMPLIGGLYNLYQYFNQ